MLPVPGGYRQSPIYNWRQYFQHAVAPLIGAGYKRLRSHYMYRTGKKPKLAAKFIKGQRSYGRAVVSTKRRRKKKLTLKKRVVKLEKKSTPLSHYIGRDTTYFRCPQFTDDNTVTSEGKYIYYFPGVQTGVLDESLKTVQYPSGNVSLVNKNTSTKISCFTKWHIKNLNIHNCNIKLMKCFPIQSTNQNPLKQITLSGVDLGYTFSKNGGNPRDLTPAAADAAAIPARIQLTKSENHYEILSLINDLHKWKHEGQITSLCLKPGESTVVVMKHSYNYDPDVRDAAGDATFLKGYDYGLVMSCVGELAQGSGDANQNKIIGLTDWDLAVKQQNHFRVTVDNGLGLVKVANTQSKDTQVDAPAVSFVAGGANNVEQ